MSSRIAWGQILVAAALGGLAGGAVVRATLPKPAPPLVVKPEVDRDVDRALADRVERLERSVSKLGLDRAVSRAAAAPVPTAREGAAEPHHTVDDPVFQAAVRDVVDQRDEERRASRNKRTAQRLGDSLELDAQQQQAVAALLQEMFTSLRELRDSEQDPTGTKSRELRAKAEERFAEVVTPSQLAKYRALDDTERPFNPNRRGPPFGF